MANQDYSGSTPQAGETSQTQTGSATETAKKQASDVAQQAKEQATSQLSAQKDRATDQLGTISEALRETSQNLRTRDADAVAGYMDDAARQVEHFAGYLRNHSLSEMMGEVEHYARREPGLFLGGAMLLGLAGSRFFKSSSPRRSYGERRLQGSRAYDRHRSGYEERSSERYPDVARREGAAYSQVHGTAGAEMPDTSRGTTAAGSVGTPGASPTGATSPTGSSERTTTSGSGEEKRGTQNRSDEGRREA